MVQILFHKGRVAFDCANVNEGVRGSDDEVLRDDGEFRGDNDESFHSDVDRRNDDDNLHESDDDVQVNGGDGGILESGEEESSMTVIDGDGGIRDVRICDDESHNNDGRGKNDGDGNDVLDDDGDHNHLDEKRGCFVR